MSIWCIRPEEVKYERSFTAEDGQAYPFWIKLKRRLTIGEERKVQMSGWKGLKQGKGGEGAEIQINWQAQSFARTETYLTDWSLIDDDAKKLPLTRETIESLNPKVYELIEGLVNEHVLSMTEEKKVQSGSGAPETMSA